MTEEAPVVVDPSQPIVYGKPRYMVSILIILTVVAVASLAAAVNSARTRGAVDGATDSDVRRNRELVRALADSEREREQDNAAHRERNELAHACQEQLLIKLLALHGERVRVDFAVPEPCKDYQQIGVVPPETTTATRRRTTTTAPRRRTSATTTTTAVTTTAPSTTATSGPRPTTSCPGSVCVVP